MIDIRLPNITATTEKGQLEQIHSYLYQFAQQLTWALGNIDKKADEVVRQAETSAKKKDEAEQAKATFAEVKSLIIKSADIVNAYYEEISHRLEGSYVAQSDFGKYQQETAAVLSATSTDIGVLFENTQTMQSDLANVNGVLQIGAEGTTILSAQARCHIGVLKYDESGFPIYGMEIGQTNTQDGETVYKKFAQYRSDGVHLFDQNETEVATISDSILKITNAKITGALDLGGYAIRTENGLAFKWAGG